MNNYIKLFLLGILVMSFSLKGKETKQNDRKINNSQTIRISTEFPNYFETDKGEAWIPVSINYLPYDYKDDKQFILTEQYFKRFSENGGNSMRIWISTPFLEIEDKKEGEYNPLKFERIDKLLALAKKYHILIKFTLNHVRTISSEKSLVKSWSNSNALASAFNNMDDYLNTSKGRTSYLNRARALGKRYKNNRQIYCWELWNEVNAASGNWQDFTSQMLDSVKNIFPNQLVVQTLGSLDSYRNEESYKELFKCKNNSFVSIHRYLINGNESKLYSFVKGPIDKLVSTAFNFTRKYVKDRPIIMNEIGAEEGDYQGPSRYYKKDKEGVLIHDMIFAPFFCGAAGSGSMWHWDHYVNPNNLWVHFRKFKSAIEGIDPIKERFENFTFESNGVRCYGLKGLTKTIIWCRDSTNSWKTEFEQEIKPLLKKDFYFDTHLIGSKKYSSVKFYDPWKESWINGKIDDNKIKVPSFTRSIVIVLQ